MFIPPKGCGIMNGFVERWLDVHKMLTNTDYRFPEIVRGGRRIRQSTVYRARTGMSKTDGGIGQYFLGRGEVRKRQIGQLSKAGSKTNTTKRKKIK